MATVDALDVTCLARWVFVDAFGSGVASGVMVAKGIDTGRAEFFVVLVFTFCFSVSIAWRCRRNGWRYSASLCPTIISAHSRHADPIRGIAKLGPATVAPLGLLSPVVAVVIGWLALDQHLTPTQLFGMSVVLASILMSGQAPPPKSEESAKV